MATYHKRNALPRATVNNNRATQIPANRITDSLHEPQ